jgi:hypothetical protein
VASSEAVAYPHGGGGGGARVQILLSILALLSEPNPDHPLVPEIADVLRSNKKAHDAQAAEWTRLYATPVDKK